MVGLAGRQSASNFFIYLFLLLVFAVLIIQQLAFFASFASSSSLNAYSACVVLLLILFGGFIIPPVAIPDYYTWLYWWNPVSIWSKRLCHLDADLTSLLSTCSSLPGRTEHLL